VCVRLPSLKGGGVKYGECFTCRRRCWKPDLQILSSTGGQNASEYLKVCKTVRDDRPAKPAKVQQKSRRRSFNPLWRGGASFARRSGSRRTRSAEPQTTGLHSLSNKSDRRLIFLSFTFSSVQRGSDLLVWTCHYFPLRCRWGRRVAAKAPFTVCTQPVLRNG